MPEVKELLEKLEKASAERYAAQEMALKAIEAKAEKTEVAALKERFVKSDEAVEKITAQLKAADEILKGLQAEQKRGFNGGKRESAGEIFVKSDAFLSAMKNGLNSTGKINVKAITSAADSAGALARPFRDPTIYDYTGGRPAVRIRDLLTEIPVAEGSVEITRLVTRAAAAQSQAGELAPKAQNDIAYSFVTAPVITIASWFVASRQILADVPRLQAQIDSELIYAQELALDNEILLGDGTSNHFLGVMNDPVINQVPAPASDTGAAMLGQIRKGITLLQKADYYSPNGVLLNPVDLEKIEISVGNDGHYIVVPYAATSNGVANTPALWRIPVVVANAIPESEFLLGDWRIGAQLYNRQEATIRIAEQHEDNFTRNAVTILGEERFAFGVSRPKAFAKGAFTPAP